jgi:hypothetical protein
MSANVILATREGQSAGRHDEKAAELEEKL